MMLYNWSLQNYFQITNVANLKKLD
uniref:Uncharacterized protein n=1 Tax=Rhizophora mucronata TaxID=61149 RepID=A0A2P2JAI2_RHIMU